MTGTGPYSDGPGLFERLTPEWGDRNAQRQGSAWITVRATPVTGRVAVQLAVRLTEC